MTDAEQPRMTKLPMAGPLNESDLDDDLGADPMRAETRQADGFGEGRLRYFERVELLAKLTQQLRVEAGADPARENEIIAVVIADQQGAEADALSLWIGETTDDELLGQLALHLQPTSRPALFID